MIDTKIADIKYMVRFDKLKYDCSHFVGQVSFSLLSWRQFYQS